MGKGGLLKKKSEPVGEAPLPRSPFESATVAVASAEVARTFIKFEISSQVIYKQCVDKNA